MDARSRGPKPEVVKNLPACGAAATGLSSIAVDNDAGRLDHSETVRAFPGILGGW
jgi:hypothetical protein